MKKIFGDIAIKEFRATFSEEEKCLAFLADEKWKDGFICRHCGNKNYCKGKKAFSRRCTRCKKEESATAHTIFHHCRIPLVNAFNMVYNICHDPTVSTYELSRQFETRQMTCWKLKKKIMECVESKGELKLVDFAVPSKG
jgi:hypothetical protein